ncbi:MAG: DUF6249 domain-containing protein [Pseudomonadota bacterium]
MSEEWIPIIMFLSIALILIALFWFRFKTRAEMQSTLRSALDKGQELTPEIIDRLGMPKENPNKDLRRGVIWLSLAVGLALCGISVPDPSGHALRGCLAGAAFPLAIGVGYMIIHFVTRKDKV